jgi:hypothetical protein
MATEAPHHPTPEHSTDAEKFKGSQSRQSEKEENFFRRNKKKIALGSAVAVLAGGAAIVTKPWEGNETPAGNPPAAGERPGEDEPAPVEHGEVVTAEYETRRVGETFEINDREMRLDTPIRNVDDWIIDAVDNSTAVIAEYTPASPGTEYLAVPIESHRDVDSVRTLIDDMHIVLVDNDDNEVEPRWRLSPDGRTQLQLSTDGDLDPNNQTMHYVFEVPSDSVEPGKVLIAQNFLDPGSEPFTDVFVEWDTTDANGYQTAEPEAAEELPSSEIARSAEVKVSEEAAWRVETGDVLRGEEALKLITDTYGYAEPLPTGFEYFAVRIDVRSLDGKPTHNLLWYTVPRLESVATGEEVHEDEYIEAGELSLITTPDHQDPFLEYEGGNRSDYDLYAIFEAETRRIDEGVKLVFEDKTGANQMKKFELSIPHKN